MESDIRILVDYFIKEKSASCALRTVEYYKDNLDRFIDFLNNRDITDVQDITRADYIDYITFLRSNGIKNISVRTYCRAVSVFGNWLVDNEIRAYSYTMGVKLPKKDNGIIVPLTLKEVNVLDEAIYMQGNSSRNIIIFHLMLDCGLRKREVLNLKVKDINFQDKYIVINNSKGNKSRMVPVPDFLLNKMQHYSPKRIKHRYYFVSDTRPMTDNAIKMFFYKLKTETGIERLKPHLLRHTFATSFILGGGNMEMLRVLMGHSDYTITQTYLHIASQSQILGTDIYRLDPVFFKNYNTF